MEKLNKKIATNKLYQKHKEKIKFVLVGGLNTGLDFVLFGTLANIFKVDPVAANMVSTSFCMGVSFLLNYNFVWKSTKSKKETAPKFVVVSL